MKWPPQGMGETHLQQCRVSSENNVEFKGPKRESTHSAKRARAICYRLPLRVWNTHAFTYTRTFCISMSVFRKDRLKCTGGGLCVSWLNVTLAVVLYFCKNAESKYGENEWFLILSSIIRESGSYSLPSVHTFQLFKKLKKAKRKTNSSIPKGTLHLFWGKGLPWWHSG